MAVGHDTWSEFDNALKGMSADQIREMLWVQELKLRTFGHLLAAIPPCSEHGGECVAGAIQWIWRMKKIDEVLHGGKTLTGQA